MYVLIFVLTIFHFIFKIIVLLKISDGRNKNLMKYLRFINRSKKQQL